MEPWLINGSKPALSIINESLPPYPPPCLQVESNQKMSAMMDAISLHNLGGKSIVFVNTKAMCDQVRGGGAEGGASEEGRAR